MIFLKGNAIFAGNSNKAGIAKNWYLVAGGDTTSLAAARVSAALARIADELDIVDTSNGEMAAARRRLLLTAKYMGSDAGCKQNARKALGECVDDEYGYGLLNEDGYLKPAHYLIQGL